ncbi:histidine phosphatase family protein [Candidatus Binatia bacterium]|nr:histidine phosphatase family protein [Candidatus Binatia bacterium]
MRALLIRHGESSGQEPEAALTPRGLRQGDELAAALRGESIGRVLSSPYRRARQTAEFVAAGTEPHIDDRLREWELPWVPDTDWPSALRPILAGRVPLAPDVEPIAEARARGLAVLHEALSDESGLPVLVTHGKLLSLVLSRIACSDPYEVFIGLRNPHVFEVAGSDGQLQVRSVWHPGV